MDDENAVFESRDYEDSLSLKTGARNNTTDRGTIREIRRLAGEITNHTMSLEPNDSDPEPEQPEVVTIPIRSLHDDELVAFGDAVKSLDNGHFGGYLVRFSSEDDPDLTGQYFTKATNFGISDGAKTPIYLNHRYPISTKDGKNYLVKDEIGEGTLSIDDMGVLIDAILFERDEYEKAFADQMRKGMLKTALGWSSGTAPHLVDISKSGKAEMITRWPLGLDASMTPTPAEPRNSVIPLKSLSVEQNPHEITETPTGEAEAALETAPSDGGGERVEQPTPIKSLMEDNAMDDEKIQEIINSAVKTALAEAKSNGNGGYPGVQVTTDEADQPWARPGDFFKAVKHAAYYPREADARLRPLKATGMSEGVPSDGGYLVVPQFSSRILERMYTNGQILSRVAQDPISSNAMTYHAVSESSRAAGSHYGGITAYWTAEGGTISSSKPAFEDLNMKLKKLAVLAYATDEQLEDTAFLESWLARVVPDELSWYVEESIINGDGVGKPLGILNAPSLVTVLRVDASEVDTTDLAQMWSHRYPGVKDYVWLVDPSVFPQLANMTLGNFPVFWANNVIMDAPSGSIYGRPVIETEHNQALGTTGDIILASLSQYQTITKGGVKAATSIHLAFTTDEQAFRWTYRIDGQPSWSSYVTTTSGTYMSPFVVLGASV